ncbi:hypothetical protein ACFUR9_33325, partial [Streptomyces cinereoruber]
MRGPAAPTSPGARDARAEVLLGTPALTAAVEEPPSGIVRAPGAATATPPRPHPTDPALQENREERPAEPPPAHEPPMDRATPSTPPAPPAVKPEAPAVHRLEAPAVKPAPPAVKPEAPAVKPAPPAPRPRHGTADPVKVLLHRHRELCERAVDPLEVAAGLEAQGFTDRTAARYRHRDVFSLAEELYARVPRRPEEVRVAEDRPEPVAPWALAVLAPGAVAALAWLGLA